VTNLPFATPPGDPYAYALLTLSGEPGAAGTAGSGGTAAPDTLYEADLTAGAVVKYGLVDGAWVAQGSAPVTGAAGLTANDDNGTVTVYVTSSGDGTAGTLYKIVDDSGLGGTLAGTASTIATLPADEAARGVAFAPGTVIGSGGGAKPPAVRPTISTPSAALPAALGDPTNPNLPVTVADADVAADQLTVAATSSDPSVAPAGGITLTGTGADRTLTVTPGTVGVSTITLTVTAPDGTSASTQIRYGVSADLRAAAGPDGASMRYYSGAGNASAAVDVGGGYAVVADDENSVLRLYDLSRSGAPVKTFDFSARLPSGGAEVDIESVARSGDLLYWEGSMSNSSSGDAAPSRSTLFATRISGTGADTTLDYVGSYTGLLADLVNWDHTNGHGLGADYLGLAASSAPGVGGHEGDALNVEGIEFAGTGGSTAYLAFRAPLEPTTDRHLAMLVPVTNFAALPGAGDPGSVHATFGAPVLFDLGGLGIRDIRRNAAGQYLIIAGTADDTNSGSVLYAWDGDPAHAPRRTGTMLPQLPAGDNLGAWETIVGVPDPLVAGAPIQLLQDDGDAVFYGDGLTSKTGTVTDLQKSLGVVFGYAPPAAQATAVAIASTANPAAPGRPVTLTTTVRGPAGAATPTGRVTFSITGADGSTATCASPNGGQLTAGVATCTLPAGALRAAASPYTVTAGYPGDGDFAAGGATLRQAVAGTPTTTTAAVVALAPRAGQPVVVLAAVTPNRLAPALLTGSVDVTVTDAAGHRVYATHSGLLPILPLAVVTVPGSALATAGKYTITVSYAGDEYYSPSTTSHTIQVSKR
jgi:hypothetical protein